jgi:hypothetical protein
VCISRRTGKDGWYGTAAGRWIAKEATGPMKLTQTGQSHVADEVLGADWPCSITWAPALVQTSVSSRGAMKGEATDAPTERANQTNT